MLIKTINAVLAVLAGVGGALVLFWVLNRLVGLLPGKWEDRLKPYVYIGPAFLAISLYLIYPAIQTIHFSFANADSTAYVGLDNYTSLLGSAGFRSTLVNTLLWIVIVPAVTIALGLGIAVLSDRLRPRAEKLAKTAIFMPMAISAVGAGTIWRFVYATNPPGEPQIGVQNAIVTALGFDPVNWLQITDFKFNSLELMVMLLWAQVGFSMVLLSAAIKGVPADTLEAARIDGARERQIFFKVIVPQIRGTIITVFVTVTIGVMKLFDIVYVMTNGDFDTNVIGVQFFNELFTNFNNGHAAAIVVMLMIAIIPIMIYQVRQFRTEEAGR
ncbi:sugar ABC transporter permease [Nonomuraea sp. NBC_00507]|jgi:alpha-glucoside transport system permease protein|uniref:carbohydrate ABC transporter permease n=1 Tax=unclassified Nonomuraea TaxID=2593643 RepID=UPI00273C32D4|nr:MULTISPECIES: sugar ABC transporter permease [unclassified Nonomuraea]MDP4509228.1 sugar ABC transporter permease [Nonomuraea sp. G32]